MQYLRQFLSFNHSDRILLFRAMVLLVTIRIGLKLLRFQTLRRWLTRLAQPPVWTNKKKLLSIYKLIWSVTIASSYLPGIKCLARALEGYAAQLRLGVTKDKKGQLLGHAWVESQGKVVIGGVGTMTKYYNVISLPEWETLNPEQNYSFSE